MFLMYLKYHVWFPLCSIHFMYKDINSYTTVKPKRDISVLERQCIFMWFIVCMYGMNFHKNTINTRTRRSKVMSIYYNISRACSIYCTGPVLQTVQLSGLFNDSKTFVDMPMRYEPEETLAAFEALTNPSGNLTELQNFLDDYFLPVGSDLVPWVPPDYLSDPPIIQEMSDGYFYKNFTRDINALWLVLGRNITESVVQHPERHSFVPLANPMIVPGGRFRESYYWDTWWIMRGLLVCDMNTTAYYVLDNLMNEVEMFEFVPNGARIYYLDRSQPPVLSQMIVDYVNYNIHEFNLTSPSTGKVVLTPFLSTLVSRGISILETEYAWWMNVSYTQHAIPFTMSTSIISQEDQPYLNPTQASEITVFLNRYHSNASTPRPESFTEDYYDSLSDIRTLPEVTTFYHNVRGGAESGWDFSSRWISGLMNISYIATTEIIPIELNCFLYKLEMNLAYLLSLQANEVTSEAEKRTLQTQATNYTAQAKLRYYGIQSFLWDNATFHWRDYNLTSQSFAQRNESVGPEKDGNSNSYSTVAYWLPLWAEIYPDMNTTIAQQVDALFPSSDTKSTEPSQSTSLTTLDTCEQLLTSLLASGIIQDAGILTTTAQGTNQQWDAPNAWPPLVWLLIDGLKSLSKNAFVSSSTSSSPNKFCSAANNLALNITDNWLWTNYLAFNASGYMYEKYNAYEIGVGGGGGEYTPQIGFGWSNGVALLLINDTFRMNQTWSHHFPHYVDTDDVNDDTFIITNNNDDDLPIPVGAFVAAVLLPFLFVIIIVASIFFCYRKQRDHSLGLQAPILVATPAEVLSPIANTGHHSSPNQQTTNNNEMVQLVDQSHIVNVDHTHNNNTTERASVATVTALPV